MIKIFTQQKGLSLVEVLVATAILAVVALPFLSVFLSTARNNADSRETLLASTLAQQVMTELKSKSPAELMANAGAVYYQDDKMEAVYTVENVLSPGIIIGSNFVSPLDYALELLIDAATVTLTDNQGTSGSYPLADHYRLVVAGSENPYSYVFSRASDQQLLGSGQLLAQAQNVNIHINTSDQRSSTDPQLIMAVTIDPAFPVAENVNFFLAGGTVACSLFNEGNRDFYQFSNLSQTTPPTQPVLYRITVEVRKPPQQELLSRLLSYELK